MCATRDGNTHGVNTYRDTACGCETVGWFHPNRAGHRAMRDAYARMGAARFPSRFASIPSPGNGTPIADVSTNSVFVAVGGSLFPAHGDHENFYALYEQAGRRP